MAMNYESLLPVSVRAITVSHGIEPNKMLKSGFPITIVRMLVAIAAGYIMLLVWPGFGELT